MGKEGAEMKVFRMRKEKNHKTDMVGRLAVSRTIEMLVNVFVKVAEVLCTKHILIGSIEKKKNRQTPIL